MIVRPGVVFGPGNEAIHGRVGLGTFGLFLHLGGRNPVPFSYVENCADAIVLAGLIPGIDGEVFDIVDDEPPSSRQFLRLYKRHVRPFRSVDVPHALSFLLRWAWESISGGRVASCRRFSTGRCGTCTGKPRVQQRQGQDGAELGALRLDNRRPAGAFRSLPHGAAECLEWPSWAAAR